jgi:hypothetical protein
MTSTPAAIVYGGTVANISAFGVDNFERGKLIVPGKFLRALEIFDPADVHPHAVMPKRKCR